MNVAANRGGMIAFIFSMAFSILFIGLVTAFQPGPIDRVMFGAPGLTEKDLVLRKTEWSKSSPEVISKGKELFEINFGFQMQKGQFEKLVESLNGGELKDQTSEIRMFNLITNGFEDPSRNKFSYFPESERWAMAHYLRSLVKNPEGLNKKEMDAYLHYGL